MKNTKKNTQKKKTNKRQRSVRLVVSIIAAVMALMLVLPLILDAFLVGASAKSSSELKEELDALEEEAYAITLKQQELEEQLDDNAAETSDTVEQKSVVDQQIEITRLQIENTQEQIQQYNLLIAEKQQELDAAEAAENAMRQTFQARIRAMEESGDISYWEILFDASSFSDLLSRVDMIADIAESDQVMMKQLAAATEQVAAARESLEEEKLCLQEAQSLLDEQEARLDEERTAQSDLINALLADAAKMEAAAEEYDEKENELLAQIAEVNDAYDEALVKEEEERRAAEAAAAAAQTSSYSGSSSGSVSGTFIYPLASRYAITDAFGYRYHPVYGYYSFHYGVDFAAGYGVAILASRSGTVTTAAYSDAYGYHVTVLHSDGSYTLYAHMPGLIVSAGQYVSQGEVIGYVGSTGYSTGPHLHFGINIGGTWVNPMDYV